MQMEQIPTKVLMIDDEENAFSSLELQAKRRGFKLEYAKTGEEGKKALMSDSDFQAIILDGRGVSKENEVEKIGFISNFMHWLEDYEKNNARSIAKLIYTGNKELVEELDLGNYPIFSKSDFAENEATRNLMFSALRQEIEKSDYNKTLKEHKEVLEIFDEKYLNSSKQKIKVIEAISNLSTSTQENYDYTQLRKILEFVLKNMLSHENCENIFPHSLSVSNNIVSDFYKFLKGEQGKPRIPYHILECFKAVRNLGNNASHDRSSNKHENKILRTKYTAQYTLYAFLELLSYFKRVLDRNGQLMD